jgi:negative regulator of replication initiation
MFNTFYKPTCKISNYIESVSIDSDISFCFNILEHSFFGSEIIDKSLFLIECGHWKNKPFQWSFEENQEMLEDYIPTANLGLNQKNSFNLAHPILVENLNNPNLFDFSSEKDFEKTWKYKRNSYNDIFILNNDKKEYIDLCEYRQKSPFDRTKLFHPIPFLTNSEPHDGLPFENLNNSSRGSWSNCKLEVVRSLLEVPVEYTNISDITFYKEDDKFDLHFNQFKIQTLRAQLSEDKKNNKVFSSLENSSVYFKNSKEVSKYLQNNGPCILYFKDDNGLFQQTTVSLDKKFDLTFTKEEELWFFDEKEQKIKSIPNKNFIKITKI